VTHFIFVSQVLWSHTQTQRYLLKLNATEQHQAQGYGHSLRLKHFVASRLLLKHALNWLSDSPKNWLFAKEQGRLIIASPPVDWHISLTHSEDYVACLVSPQAHCGIDLEQRIYKPRFLAIAQRFFSASEYQSLQQLPTEQAFVYFLDWWTRKEACIKAWHVGIAHHLATIEFSPHQLTPIAFPHRYQQLPLQLHTLATPHWQLACAVHDTNPQWQFNEIQL
jgi:4'-phosphopantetheinyl transferase